MLDQPPRRLRRIQHHKQKKTSRNQLGREHVPPAALAIPGLNDLLRAYTADRGFSNNQIDYLRSKHTQNDGELVHGNHGAATVLRTDFRNVDWRQRGRQANTDATHNSKHDEQPQRAGCRRKGRRNYEQAGRQQQRFPAAVSLGHLARQTGASNASYQCRADHPSGDTRRAYIEVGFVKGLGAANNHPVVTEQKAATSRGQTNPP